MTEKDFIKEFLSVSEEDYEKLLINPKLMCELMVAYNEEMKRIEESQKFTDIVQVGLAPKHSCIHQPQVFNPYQPITNKP